MFDWLKSKFATIGLVIGGILLALAGARAAKRKASAARKEEKIADLMQSASSADLERADKLIKAAGRDKLKANQAKEQLEKQLQTLGESNADIDAIADRFNSRRVRRAG